LTNNPRLKTFPNPLYKLILYCYQGFSPNPKTKTIATSINALSKHKELIMNPKRSWKGRNVSNANAMVISKPIALIKRLSPLET